MFIINSLLVIESSFLFNVKYILFSRKFFIRSISNDFMKREPIISIFVLFFLILFIRISFVSANFACGEVLNNLEVNPSWLEASIRYSDNPDYIATCKISPGNRKYCCDPRAIRQVNWMIGKELSARIFNQYPAYLSDSVSLNISGGGFDVFPLLKLRKGIIIHEPRETLYVNLTKIFVNISVDGYFNQINYSLERSDGYTIGGIACIECNHSEFYLNLSQEGKYELVIYAVRDNEYMFEKHKFLNLDFFNVEHKVECVGCEGRFVPPNSVVKLSLEIESSHNLSGEEIFDYLPNGWQVLDEKVSVSPYSRTHNKVKFEITDGNKIEPYLVKSPKGVIPERYVFYNGIFNRAFEGESEIILSRFLKLRWLSKKVSYDKTEINDEMVVEHLMISNSQPLYMNLKNEFVLETAIFPNKESEKIKIYFFDNLKVKMKKSLTDFSVMSDLNNEDVDSVYVKFRVKKSKIEDDEKAVLYFYDNRNNWVSLKTDMVGEDSEYYYYTAFSNRGGFFAINKIKIDKKNG